MMYKHLLPLLILFVSLTISPKSEKDKVKSVKAQYIYASDNKDESIKQAEANAFFRARCQAIQDEFGANVTGETDIVTTNENGHTSVVFRQRGGTEVRADWLKTVKEKVVSRTITDDGFMVIEVYVEGLAREIKIAGVNFECHLLRNGDKPENEDDRFRFNDLLCLAFQAPADGYLAICLTDDERAYCLLPYAEQTNGIYQIKANSKYVFFSEDHCQPLEKNYNLKVRLVTNREYEVNTVYIVFSQNPFTILPNEDGQKLSENLVFARNVEVNKFEDWLYKCRRKDPEMVVEKKTITITKK